VPRPPFATLLLELRKAAGLTQDDLASRAGLGVRTVRDLESGRATRPQRSTVATRSNSAMPAASSPRGVAW
jgi:transcriptional regulator with XRE-family HTH domain